MMRNALGLLTIGALASCASVDRVGEFDAAVRPALAPRVASVPGVHGRQPVAASRDDRGVQSDFVEGVVLLRVRSDADLPAYLARFGGTVIRDNALADLPASWGIQLTPEQRKATTYFIRIDPARANLVDMAANARTAGVRGRLEFSSQLALLTFATIVEARVAGFKAGGDFVYRPQQAFPRVLLLSNERGGVDALSERRYGSTGSATNVALAWQFVSAHGIARRVRVAIVDSGFWLDATGHARGADSDFPPPPAVPMQYDKFASRPIADGPNGELCTNDLPCFWHGTATAGVALGIMSNGKGFAGTGSLVADPLLIKTDFEEGDVKDAVKVAIAMGADVVSMSIGNSCDVFCRVSERDDTTFDDAVNVGNRPVFVASAGNDNDYVGDPHYVHPCIENHVICVGALSDPPNDTTKWANSNYGESVDVFAPQNLPVMSFPSSFDAAGNPLPIEQAFGPEVPQTFGGTSASAPFVAGIAAMMKAIDPNLNSDDVATILRETAHPGDPPGTFIVDALAAVRRAARGIPIVDDRNEPNDIDTTATNLGVGSSYLQTDLNIGGGDRDFFRFVVPAPSTATITLTYPRPLGDLSVADFRPDSVACAEPAVLPETPYPGDVRRILNYRVAGGPHVLGLEAAAVNAYHMSIGFAAASIAADAYEPNDTPATAASLFSIVRTPHAGFGPAGISYSPRVRIDATIHSASDVDYYIVQGAAPTRKEALLLAATPTLKVTSNESQIRVEVRRLGFSLHAAGSVVASVSSAACAKSALVVPLEPDLFYLVRVSGAAGAYVLANGVDGEAPHLPGLVHDGVYNVVHPGEPVERSLPYVEDRYVLPGDREYGAIRSADARVHLQLLDARGTLVGEGVRDERGERLDLASTRADTAYLLKVVRRDRDAEPPSVALQWQPVRAARTSANLIVNPGAESGDRSAIDGWQAVRGEARPQLYGALGGASLSGPGPQQRGRRYFAAAGNGRSSVLRQVVYVDPGWRDAVAQGRVKARFSAYLGGLSGEEDVAVATVTFVDAAGRNLGVMALPPVSALEREGVTGLFPSEADDDVPRDTAALRVDLAFTRHGKGRRSRGLVGASADELALVLTEYPR